MIDTDIANLVAKLTLDTSGFTSASGSFDAGSIQKSIQSAVDNTEIDIRHYGLATEADELREANAEYGQMLDTIDAAHDVSVAIAEQMGTWITAARDVETAWVGVTKTVNAPEGVDPDKFFGNLKAEVYQMSTEMPRTFQEIAAAMSAAGQIGVKPELLLDYTEAMLQFESATNGAVKAADASMIFGQLQTTMGSSQENISRLASSVVALGNNTATTEKSILNMANAIGGAASSAGFSDAQIMGWSAALNSVGLESGRAGTAFSTMVREMNIAATTGNDKLETFANIANMTADEFQEKWAEDSSAALQAFFAGMGAAAEENISTLYTSLDELGLEQSQAIAIAEKLSGATDTVNKSLQISQTAYSENAALAEEAAAANDTLDAQLQMFQNTITAIQGQLGESLLPVLKKISNAILPVLSNVTKFISEHPELATDITSVAIAFEGVAIAAQMATVAMAMGSLGIAPWLGAAAGIGAVIALLQLVGAGLEEVSKKAEETSEAIANMTPGTGEIEVNGWNGEIEIKEYSYTDWYDEEADEYVQARWDQFTGEWITMEEDMAKAASYTAEAFSEQTTAITESADAFSTGAATNEQLIESTGETKTAAEQANEILTQLNETLGGMPDAGAQMESLNEPMEQMKELMESQAFQQFANQPIDPAVGESWTAFGEAVGTASEGFASISGVIGEGGGLNLLPIPDDTLTSYQQFADAVKAINDALSGGEEAVEGEEGGGGLIGAFTSLPELMTGVQTSASALADYFTGDFITAITTLNMALALIDTDEEGSGESGGNTLYNSLGAIFGVLADILATSKNIVAEWTGPLVEASNTLKEACGPVNGVVTELAASADSAAAAYNSWAAAIWAVVEALDALNGKRGSGLGIGTVLGGARAGGGPVDRRETYLVGENGPELFTPNRSGYIVSNDDLQERQSGVTVNVGDVYGETWLKNYVITTMTGAIRKEMRLAA